MSNEDSISRRDFFKSGLKSLADSLKETAVILYSKEEEKETYKSSLIRPPGALPEKIFLDKCTRCNECVKICPEESILKFIKEGSPLHLTPILKLRESPCVMCEDFPCVKVCEPKALVQLVIPNGMKIGTATVDTQICYAWNGQLCDKCIQICPLQGKAIWADESCRPKINPEICTGCGQCEKICPTTNPAIFIKS